MYHFVWPYRQLSNTCSDSSEWSNKYQRAEQGRLAALSEKDSLQRDLSVQLSQAEQRASQANSKLSEAQQQVNDAQVTLTRERQQWEQKLRDAQAQAQAAAVPASTRPGE